MCYCCVASAKGKGKERGGEGRGGDESQGGAEGTWAGVLRVLSIPGPSSLAAD